MRKALLMAGALLAMTATFASAAGLELAWNACFSQAGAVSMRTSACGVNTGNQAMYASFRAPANVNQLEGAEIFIDYQVLGGVLPCWWNFSLGNLRQPALVALHTSPTDINGAPVVACDNHYFLDNAAAGGGGMVVTGVDRGQLKGIVAIQAGTGLPVAADAQQYACGFRITNANTTGGTCLGCLNQACFVLNTINLALAPGTPSLPIHAPHPGSENWITWQGDAVSTLCPGATPTRNATWGSVKSLYR